MLTGIMAISGGARDAIGPGAIVGLGEQHAVGHVEAYVATIRELLVEAHQRVTALEGRLTLGLRPSPPNGEAGNGQAASNMPVESKLSEQSRECILGLRSLIDRMEDLYSRVDL